MEVDKIAYVDTKDLPVNALTNSIELKTLQDKANQNIKYDDKIYNFSEWYKDGVDVMFNMIPELLYNDQPIGVTIQKGNRLRGIAVILITLGLISLIVEAMMSDV